MDLYVVLGVLRGATDAEIKRAYRRLARRFHPDINPGDGVAEVRFREILEAYETLLDPRLRSRYDLGEYERPAADAARSGFEGFDFATGSGEQVATFGDLFADVITNRVEASSHQQRGADLHAKVSVSFQDSLAGVVQHVPLTRRRACSACTGRGATSSDGARCLLCHGEGTVRSARGHMVFTRVCPSCRGGGERRSVACRRCVGVGFETRSESVALRIPPGITDGEQLRLAREGNAGIGGAPTGDLYVSVHVAPDDVFRRDGDDLYVIVTVAIHEAGLGARIRVPAPDGEALVRIRPGTQSGQRYRVRGRGATSRRTGRRGDLVVEVWIVLPDVLDERSKALLREFGMINDADVRRQPATRSGG